MKRSKDRILTTHTGSLPRPDDLRDMISAAEAGQPVEAGRFRMRVGEAVRDVVGLQRKAGLDVINDGEESKPGYSTYIKDRCTGFEGESRSSMVQGEGKDFPEWAARRSIGFFKRPSPFRAIRESPVARTA